MTDNNAQEERSDEAVLVLRDVQTWLKAEFDQRIEQEIAETLAHSRQEKVIEPTSQVPVNVFRYILVVLGICSVFVGIFLGSVISQKLAEQHKEEPDIHPPTPPSLPPFYQMPPSLTISRPTISAKPSSQPTAAAPLSFVAEPSSNPILMQWLGRISAKEVLVDPSSEQFRARAYIENVLNKNDITLVDEDAETIVPIIQMKQSIIQMYVAVLFAYAAGIEGRVSTDFFFQGTELLFVCNWNDKDTKGLFCDEESNISRILLPHQQLSGSIVSEISFLTSLESLDLSFNHLRGSLPDTLGSIASLQMINVAGNNLIGSLPPAIGSLTNLVVLDVEANLLSGPVPLFGTPIAPMKGGIGSLKRLNLNSNIGISGNIEILLSSLPATLTELQCNLCHLDGSIPPEQLERLWNLRVMTLQDTGIEGSVPSTIGALSKLTMLNLAFNELNGSLPSEIALLTDLKVLKLQETSLTGTIPSSIVSKLPKLEILYLQNNKFQGTIPLWNNNTTTQTVLRQVDLRENSMTGDLEKILLSLQSSVFEALRLGGNSLSGSLPSTMNEFVSLETLDLSKTRDITGTIPTQLATLPNLSTLNLEGNKMEGSVPSQLAKMSSLETLRLHENRFIGNMDDAFCPLYNETDFLFKVLTADCYQSNPKVQCRCCTNCIINL